MENDACGGHNHIGKNVFNNAGGTEKEYLKNDAKADLYIIDENFPLIIDEASQRTVGAKGKRSDETELG